MTDYQTFLQNKIVLAQRAGLTIDRSLLAPDNFPHQNDSIAWAAEQGRALLAMSFGLGKTRIQCELARQIVHHTGLPFLAVTPLGVKHQFQEEDGPRLGMDWQYVRTDAEVRAATSPYLITNYERVRDGSINPAGLNFDNDSEDGTTTADREPALGFELGGVSLDEGSVLRSLGSKTSQVFKAAFANVPFRFVATATPSPNDYKELIYYAEWLGVMDHGQALTRWFKRDPQLAGHLTLHPHHERDFWMWVSSWALFLFKPSDLGYSDAGYDLPELRVHWHRIAVDQSRAFGQIDNHGQHRLLLNAAGGVREATAEKRATLPDRIDAMLKIVGAEPDAHWLVWHHLEQERKAIEAALPNAVTVYGSQDLEVRESRIIGFAHGDIPILATKPEIAGSGCNFQRYCHSNIFLGVDYKFQDFIQAIHRTYRFQQTEPVDVHILYAESEEPIVGSLKEKWAQHDRLIEVTRHIMQQYGLSHENKQRDLARTIGIERQQATGQLFTAVNNDCVREVRALPDNFAGLIHTSIPFGNHFEYTSSVEDFGHNLTDAEFWEQMEYLIPELLRVCQPGRLALIHVKDRILYGHQTPTGFMEVSPFSSECIMAFRKHGWLYEGQRTILTDVVRENNSTYRLTWSEMTTDASKMGSGLPEYLLQFRKAPTNTDNQRADVPVAKDKADFSISRWQIDASSLWQSNGNRALLPDEIYNYEAHVARLERLERVGNLPKTFCADPPVSHSGAVWDDIATMRTLNSNQAQHREANHICPLPFDIVERVIELYSNPGDVVLDPFAGLFTVPYVAIKRGRYGHGIELNPTYYANGVRYCQDAEAQATLPTLFDLLAPAAAPEEPEHA